MTQILIDTSPLCENNLSGIGVYTLNFIKNVSTQKNITPVFGLPLKKFKYKNKIEKIIENKVHLLPSLTSATKFNIAINHGLDFKLSFPSRGKKIITIHDMAAFEPNLLDSNFAFNSRKKLYSNIENKKPDHIICVSNFTRERFVHFFPHYEKKTSVIYLGCNHINNSSSSINKTTEAPYILFVGNIEKRKNLKLLLDAFYILKENKSELNLKIVGKLGYQGQEILTLISNHKYKQFIETTGYVSNIDLLSLYENSRVFVYPSIYEGFGIPVLEAMMRKIPVVAVNKSAISELATGASLLVDPKYPEMMSYAIRKAHEDEFFRKVLIQEGYSRALQFTWKKCAGETFQVYQNLMMEQTFNLFSIRENYNLI